MLTRVFGLLLLSIFALCLWRLHESVLAAPRHMPTVAEMLLSLAAMLAGAGGAACATIGPSLFRPCRCRRATGWAGTAPGNPDRRLSAEPRSAAIDNRNGRRQGRSGEPQFAPNRTAA
jgi:hypothetical protein